MRLSVKFSGAVLLLLALSLGCAAWLLIRQQTRSLHDEALERSRILLSMGEASREYARMTLSPAVRKVVDPHKGGLIFEADSATFVARGTFDAFRKRQPGYSFREAALNPLNLANKADPYEEELIRAFVQNPKLPERSGFRTQDGSEHFYVARPIVVERVCLQCHNSPDTSPPEVVARYGREHGYGWREGEVAGAIIVTVPTDDLRADQGAMMWAVIGLFAALAVLLVVLLHLLFGWLVNRRLREARSHMEAVASNPGGTAVVPERGGDELTALARAFNQMAQAVRESHHFLERRVADRTVQLLDANRALADEVSERRRAEEAARRAMRAAEAASQAKGRFLANMSHEIRTPMNGILGMTELALGTHLTPEQRDYLQMVQSSGQGLMTILNDILDFSKIEAGKFDLDPTPFALRDLVGDTLKALAVRAHGKSLELAYRVAADVPDALIGDACRLRQVLTNLVGNAIKFTSVGEVTVHVSVDQRTEDREQRTEEETSSVLCPLSSVLLFEVKDTGIGIASDKVARIFQPFEQGDGTITRKFGGTGLGLAISSRLVEMMGGKLEAASEEGQGSTFSFSVPLAVQEPTAGGEAREVLPAGLRVLVVDGCETARLHLGEMLEGWRFQPTLAAGSDEALARLQQAGTDRQPFDLVVLGARLGEDALELTERFRRSPELATTPIVLLCHTVRPVDHARCQALGVMRRLVKPVKPSELFDAIVKAMHERPEAARAAPSGTFSPLGQSLRVLLAEDNAVNQRLAVRLLEMQGHRVTVVENGQSALEAVQREAFDVVLMDVQMPILGGFEATAAIRLWEESVGGHVPIVAMTANAMKGDREACLEVGMDGYLAKPVQPKQLYEVLVVVVEQTVGSRK